MIGLGRFGIGFGFVGLAVAGGGLASSALADNFYLKNGQVIEGSVLTGTLNSLTLQTGGAVQQASISEIERVLLKLSDGREFTGELLGWKEGVFEIRSVDGVVRVADGAVLDDLAVTAAAPVSDGLEASESAEVPVSSIAMRGLPTFILKNGDNVVGKILHATGSVVTLRAESGSASPLSRAQIETVRFEGEGGEVISGKLKGWEDGIYHLQLDDGELLASLSDDAAAASPSPTQAAAQDTVEEPLDTPVATEIEQADAAILPQSSNEGTSAAQVGAGGPANETAIAGLIEAVPDNASEPASDAADGQHLVKTLVEPVDEGGEAVIFKFQLSKPAERPLVVLYAATDASAKAGEDFEAKSGVITFATGSAYAEVRVPIIDDDRGESAEEFNLFLSGDPETILFSDRQIAAIINDND